MLNLTDDVDSNDIIGESKTNDDVDDAIQAMSSLQLKPEKEIEVIDLAEDESKVEASNATMSSLLEDNISKEITNVDIFATASSMHLCPDKVLRGYQTDSILQVSSAVSDGKQKIVLHLPTGSGKTIIATAIVKAFHQHVSNNKKMYLFYGN